MAVACLLTFSLWTAAVNAADENPVKGTNQFKTPPALDMNTLDNLQKLQKGYKVNYQVFEDRDLPIELIVTDSGDLVIPYYEGLIKAAGKTCREVAFDIKKELERTHYKRATVRVSVSSIAYTNTGTITVQGYVKSPGLQQLLPGEIYTVTMAIAKAGGGTDFANLKKVQLTRVIDGEPKNFYINVRDVQQKGRLDLDMDVKAGDLIYVPQSYFK